MSKQTKKRYDEMLKRKSKTWTKSEIDSLKRHLNGRGRNDGDSNQDVYDIYERFLTKLEKVVEFNITKEHSERGISYWNNLLFKKNGQCRNLKDFPLTESQVEIVRTFKKFTFQGYYECKVNDYGMTQYFEIFRVHSRSGEFFDYCPVHWSMPMIILEDNYGYPYTQQVVKPKPITSPDDLFKVPRLDDEVSAKFQEVETLFCDNSGMGGSNERALTKEQAEHRIEALLAEHGPLFGAITDAGQFQVCVTIYKGAVD